jgi:methyl-accepting chemotaxis protein
MSGLIGVEQLVGTLKDCNSELLSLNRSTEEDFLAVGASLREVLTKAEETSTMAKTASDLVQSEEMERCVETLQEFLGRMNRYLGASGERLELSMGILRSIMNESGRIKVPVTGFRKIVKRLRMLSISTKIESARFAANDNGFRNIADDVEKLSAIIDAKSTDILDAVDLLCKAISETLTNVSTLEAREQEQAKTMLDGAIRSFLSLSEKHTFSATVAGNIMSSSEEISQSIGEIVSLLQFHDITRQQIEHVIETFDELCEKIGTAKDRDDVTERLRNLHINDVCKLQVNQLSSARHDLVSAIEGTTANLRNVTDKAIHISREISSLIAAVDCDDSSFLARLRTDLTKIVTSLNENAEANDKLSEAVKGVAGTINDLVVFVEGIEDIGLEIELIALNARIKAAQTGEGGAALGVLAEAVRNLSDDARQQTMPVSHALTHIREIAGSLDQRQDEDGKEAEIGFMENELHELLDSLGNMDERAAATISRMERVSKALEEEIRGLVSGITVHVRSEKALQKVIKSIEGASRQAGDFGTARNGEEKVVYLKKIESRYTMHKERSVHKSSTCVQGAALPFRKETTEELGDNVELF